MKLDNISASKIPILILGLLLSPLSCLSIEQEVTSWIQKDISFLKPGVHVWDESSSQNIGHCELHWYSVMQADGKKIRIRRSSDFSKLIDEIQTPSQALAYVRFLSDFGANLGNFQREPLEDVPFCELNRSTIKFSKEVLNRCKLSDPEVKRKPAPQNTAVFVIERYVFTTTQGSKCRKEIIQGDAQKLPTRKFYFDEISKVTEVIGQHGEYQSELTPIHVKDLVGIETIKMLD